jgi:glyoxylase-like metal-dependent hydrolase (beta-lactamase superfamily II)
MITTSRVAPDIVALSSAVPGPAGMMFPVNAYCVLGTEPTLVDTGLSPVTDAFRAALWDLVDPADLRRVVVTHDDRDHTGSLRAILDEAPSARVVTNFVSMVKIGEDWMLPFDRLQLVNIGDRVPIGDDVLEVFRPPTYDSPGTLAFHAMGRNVCFGSDCFGAFLPGDVDLATTADELPLDAYVGGVAVFNSGLSPWLHDLAPDRWTAVLAGVRARGIGTWMSTHGLPVGAAFDRLLDVAAGLPTGPSFVPPGQEFVDAMLAAAH